MKIASGTTDQVIYFVCVDSSDYVTRETGKTSGDFTVFRARNSASAAEMTTPTISEISASDCPGVYTLLLDEDMTIGAGNDTEEMVFHISATGVAPITRTIELYRPKITVGETVTSSSGKVTTGTNDDKTGYSLSATPPTAAQIYSEFTSGTNENAFKADVSALATASSISSLNDLSTSQVATAVWDEAQSSHTTSGTFGKYLDAQVSSISGGGGGSGTTVYIGYAPDRIGETDITVYQGETYTATIEPKDRKGAAVDLSSKTMYVVVENELSDKDAVVIADGDLTKTSTSVSFSVSTAVTDNLSTPYRWSMRDNSTNEVYLRGMMYVEPAATKD